MKKILTLSLLAIAAMSCNNAAQTQQKSQPANTNAAPQKADDKATVSTHSLETKNDAGKGNAENIQSPNQSAGDSSPMQKPIDVAEMTAEIEKAEKARRQKPNDEDAKNALAKAYFVRAFALTEAAQYRAALGDFRKGLKLAPNDDDARNMHDEILRIFDSIKREPPKEGEEPKPLPFEKKKA